VLQKVQVESKQGRERRKVLQSHQGKRAKMMMGYKERQLKHHDGVCLDDLVPEDHFYRQLEATIDLSFVRELVQDKYCWWNGRPSIDPVVFFKLQLVMFFEGFRSERQLIEQVEVNVAFRWYIGYDLDEAIPSASNLSRTRDRYGWDVFMGFFEQIVERCIEAGLVWGDEQHVDASMIAANASYDRQVPRFYWEAIGNHVQALFAETDSIATCLVTKYNGEQATDPHNNYKRKRDYWVNTVDRDATPADYRKMGYRLHYVVDGGRARIILGCLVTPHATQDDAPMLDLAWWVRFRWRVTFKRAVADARYGTSANVLALFNNGILPYIPLLTAAAQTRRPNDKFPLAQFDYDPRLDQYTCPAGESLLYSHTISSTQRRVYKAQPHVCSQCVIRSHCTTSKHGRTVSHSTAQPQLDQIVAERDAVLYDKLVRKRMVWIEPKFGEVKQWHHGRRCRLRGIVKVNMEALIKAAGQNIKQLMKHRICHPNPPLPPAPAAIFNRCFRFLSTLVLSFTLSKPDFALC